MKRLAWIVSLAGILLPAAHGQTDPGGPKPLRGFSGSEAAAELKVEAELDSLGRTDDFRLWMQRLSARPHHLGAPYGRENAEFLAGLFRSWGYSTRIEEFQVLFPTPRERLLELLSPTPSIQYSAQLKEPPLGSPWPQEERLPTYNAYSIDGDVTAELVYVNYGLPEDYETLARQGVSVQGRIVIARYGQAWRGVKPKVAAEHGAIGCILYSDPDLDGYGQGDVYPQGAYRPEQSVQMGSVLDIALYPGDPLTPGEGSTPGARRLARSQASTLTRIPVLPISSGDALPFLQALAGPVAPPAWRGALPVTYHLGPGPARSHLKLAFDWRQVTAYDVIAVLPGAEQPDEWIVRGNHHDAWVTGATDPVSGLVAMLEEARVIGALARAGHRPRRTIVFAAWDGEEPGFIGSTEWGEAHAEELRRKAAVYVNTDSNARGFLSPSGSLTLQRFLSEVARDVTDPQSGVSVLDRALAQLRVAGAGPAEPTISRQAGKPVDNPTVLSMEPLGSGSDFTVFEDHLGIASMDFSYCCESDYGVYHSAYDSFEHFTRFVDPKFEYETTQFQTGGRVVLRLANAGVLPFEFDGFADRVGAMVEEISGLADQMRQDTARHNEWVADDLFRIIADTRHPFVPPRPLKPVPFLSFAPLENAVHRLQTAGRRYETALGRFSHRGPLPTDAADQLGRALIDTERAFLRPEGLPGRSWYRNLLYAPGVYTGYGVKTLPGVREAVEQRSFEAVDAQVLFAAEALVRCAERVEAAAGILEALEEPR